MNDFYIAVYLSKESVYFFHHWWQECAYYPRAEMNGSYVEKQSNVIAMQCISNYNILNDSFGLLIIYS